MFLTVWTCSGALHFVWLCSWVWLPDILLFHQPTDNVSKSKTFVMFVKIVTQLLPNWSRIYTVFIHIYILGSISEEVVWYFFLYQNHNTYLFVSFNIRNNLTNVHVSPCPREKLLFISNYKLSSNWHLN